MCLGKQILIFFINITKIKFKNYFIRDGGLLNNAFVVFITNAFVATFLSFFDVGYLIRLLKRYFLV